MRVISLIISDLLQAYGYSTAIGNGFCNDETNTAACNYDGGDCCGSCINKRYCSKCACHGDVIGNGVPNALVGNSFCNDETNIKPCNYDNGDCCGHDVNSDHCLQCKCHHEETCEAGVTHSYIGDGYCNDETNNAACGYDGGDCCGSCVNTEYCLNCDCLGGITSVEITNPLVGNGLCNEETNNIECQFDGGDCCLNPALVGNSFCNDGTNIGACSYDGGDCCLLHSNSDYCSECNCLVSGVITSPGFPGNYDNNLDMVWLVQVSPEQLIEVHFYHFDVESHSICK